MQPWFVVEATPLDRLYAAIDRRVEYDRQINPWLGPDDGGGAPAAPAAAAPAGPVETVDQRLARIAWGNVAKGNVKG